MYSVISVIEQMKIVVEAQTDRNLNDQEQKTIDENLQETRQRDERKARGWWSCLMLVHASRRDASNSSDPI